MNKQTRTKVEALIRDAVERGRRSLTFRGIDLSDLADLEWMSERIVEVTPNIKSLDLSQTRMSDAGLQLLTARAGHLSSLQSLDLGDTLVGDAGLQALAAQAQHLPAMQSLVFEYSQVSDAGLQALAAQAQHLPALELLDFEGSPVGDAGLQALAAQARHFPALQSLDFRRTQVNVPEEILASRDPAPIFEYMLERERPLAEVKLLLMGQAEAGKTHLRKRLFVKQANPTYHNDHEERTHDIEMTVWSMKVEVGDRGPRSRGRKKVAEGRQTQATDVLCRVWDFGGQNHLHGSHRFFVGAERCLYLLMLNATRNAEQNRLDYWLRFLAHYGRKQSGSGVSSTVERAPVLIVLTQCDQWELAGTTDNGFVDLINALTVAQQHDWYGTNVVACIDGFGWSDSVEQLEQPLQWEIKKRHIAATQRIVDELQRHIPDVLGLGYLYPRGFFAMKQWIEDYFTCGPAKPGTDANKHFNWRMNTAFCEACDEAGISEGLRQRYLAICRSLGLVHWVGDNPEIADNNVTDLKELVFNPEWIKRPVYVLIQPHDAHKRGWISNSRLRERLPAPQPAGSQSEHLYRRLPFTERDCDNVQNLMLACRVAFRVEKRRGLADGLLIPDLLESRERPHRAKWTGDDVLHFPHPFDFLPEHVFLRFIANHYKFIKDSQHNCWRDEVIVTYLDRRTNTTCEVLVQSELSPPPGDQPYLDISIRGGSPEVRERIAHNVVDDFSDILIQEELASGLIERHEEMHDQDADDASTSDADSSGGSLVQQWERVTNKDELRKLVNVTDAPFELLWVLFQKWKYDHDAWITTADIKNSEHGLDVDSSAMSKSKSKLGKALYASFRDSIHIEVRTERPAAYRLVVRNDSAAAGND